MLEIIRPKPKSELWNSIIEYAESCSWVAGKHVAEMMRENRFQDWEAVFAAVDGGSVIGFCTLMKTDYYPENRYSPWISSIFVDEHHRGSRISEKMVRHASDYAKAQGFCKVYIPSGMNGFYEKYGFEKIDELKNYGGDIDNIYSKDV